MRSAFFRLLRFGPAASDNGTGLALLPQDEPGRRGPRAAVARSGVAENFPPRFARGCCAARGAAQIHPATSLQFSFSLPNFISIAEPVFENISLAQKLSQRGQAVPLRRGIRRSEERRVGKEC